MPKYGFYSKSDKEKEIINSAYADSIYSAKNIFSVQKKLVIADFEKLYEVVEK